MIIRKQVEQLPIGNFIVHLDKDRGEYYVTESSDFSLPENIYGNYQSDIDIYMKSFKANDKNMGIMLTGIAGGGKSLLAKQLMMQSKLPVLIVSEPFSDNNFIEFINSIEQETIVFFDEFEKVYDDKGQEDLLTLFDGVYNSKKIFLLTSNSNNINEYFVNRPSRIRYTKKFTTIDEQTLAEIIDDLLVNKEHRDEIETIVNSLGSVGKDLLISMIEEVNLFDKSPKEVLKMMNIKMPKLKFSFVAIMGPDKFEGTFHKHPLGHEMLRFDKWYHGFEYEEYVTAMMQEKIGDQITLRDRTGNKFKFFKEGEFNSLDNIM